MLLRCLSVIAEDGIVRRGTAGSGRCVEQGSHLQLRVAIVETTAVAGTTMARLLERTVHSFNYAWNSSDVRATSRIPPLNCSRCCRLFARVQPPTSSLIVGGGDLSNSVYEPPIGRMSTSNLRSRAHRVEPGQTLRPDPCCCPRQDQCAVSEEEDVHRCETYVGESSQMFVHPSIRWSAATHRIDQVNALTVRDGHRTIASE